MHQQINHSLSISVSHCAGGKGRNVPGLVLWHGLKGNGGDDGMGWDDDAEGPRQEGLQERCELRPRSVHQQLLAIEPHQARLKGRVWMGNLLFPKAQKFAPQGKLANENLEFENQMLGM